MPLFLSPLDGKGNTPNAAGLRGALGQLQAPILDGRMWNFEGGDVVPFESFSRASPATAFTVSGLVVGFAVNAPRVTNKGLLLEPVASTNEVRSSWNLSNASWTKTGAPTILPTAQSPILAGETVYSVGRIQPASSSLADSNVAGAIGTTKAIQACVKRASTGGLVGVRLQGSYPDRYDVVINQDTGVVAYSGGVNFTLASTISVSLCPLGFWWVRFAVTSVVSAFARCVMGPSFGANGAWEGTSAQDSDALLTGLQVETAPAIGSYISTNGAAATRAAETASLKVSAGCTAWEATYGDSRTLTSGAGLVPGASFSLTTGRPWLGLGNELKSLQFKP